MFLALLVAASCHLGGTAPFVRPDNVCTPGSYDRLPIAQACVHKDRPYMPVAFRRAVLDRYGYDYDTWTGEVGKYDHRVPFYLGGRTDLRNMWPFPEPNPTEKDRLENYTRVRVCVRHTMRPRTAIRIFLGDWVASYRKYLAAH